MATVPDSSFSEFLSDSPRVGSWRDYDISPDGKQFLVVLPPGTASSDAPQALQIHVVLNWFEELKQRMASH